MQLCEILIKILKLINKYKIYFLQFYKVSINIEINIFKQKFFLTNIVFFFLRLTEYNIEIFFQ